MPSLKIAVPLPTSLDSLRPLLWGPTAIQTPFLAMDAARLAAQVELWHRLLPDVRLHYAVKANSDPLVVAFLRDLGCQFDVASAYELQLLARLGVSPEQVIVSHPTKTTATLRSLVDFQPWAVAVDSIQEIIRLQGVGLPTFNYAPALFVRLATRSQNVQDDLSSKFGCDSDTALECLALARRAGLTTLGLSFHVGTQCYEGANYRRAIELASEVARRAARRGIEVSWLDLGGGFCDAATARACGTTQAALLEEVAEEVSQVSPRFRLLAEPGRFVVADAGRLFTGVISETRPHHKSRQIVVDDHLYGGFCGQAFDARKFDLKALRDDVGPTLHAERAEFVVYGATCDSIDRLQSTNGHRHLLPADLTIGDVLTVDTMGAYTTTSGAPFNGIDPAGVVLVWDQEGELHWRQSPHFQRTRMMLDCVTDL